MIRKTEQTATALEITQHLFDATYTAAYKWRACEIGTAEYKRKTAYLKGWFSGVRQGQLGFDTSTAQEIDVECDRIMDHATERGFVDAHAEGVRRNKAYIAELNDTPPTA